MENRKSCEGCGFDYKDFGWRVADLVKLTSGGLCCPDCYEEVMASLEER